MPSALAVIQGIRNSLAIQDIAVGLTTCTVTTSLVLLGIAFGSVFLAEQHPQAPGEESAFLTRMSRWDGLNYRSVAIDGYAYSPDRRSNVAFFPAYPLCARFFSLLTGVTAQLSLILVANGFLAATFVLLRTYARLRFPDRDPDFWNGVVLLFGVFPTTFFFRMAYSEAMFCCFCLLVLLAMLKRWPPALVALLVGFVTAIRPVGVALVAGFAVYLFSIAQSRRQFFSATACYLPLATWGIISYVSFQAAAFGEALAFAKTQQHWTEPSLYSAPSRLTSLFTAEPITGTYDPSSFRYWRTNPKESPFFSSRFVNPIFFLLALALVLWGWAQAALNATEAVTALALLLIPYATKGYDYSMASHARFAAVVLPAYLVLAPRRPAPGSTSAFGVIPNFACFTCWYAALFGTGYLIF